jgi:hypothetical protein
VLSCRGRYARTERGRGHQKVPGQFHSARSVLMSLGSQPALTCTDSYCAQPTPYQEPSGPSGRRTRLSRARLGKATGVPRGADDPQGPNRPGAGGFARRPPGRSSWGSSLSRPKFGPSSPGAHARICLPAALHEVGSPATVASLPTGAPAGSTTQAEGITICAFSIAPVIVASAGRSGGDLASA